ncbi:hypothetical protein MKY53_11800 [Macrococcus sp. FSL R5-0951]|nr:hypothetical protein [Macrococcus bohemicus]
MKKEFKKPTIIVKPTDNVIMANKSAQCSGSSSHIIIKKSE